jgi:voltage-gated potassium channel
MAAEYAGCRRAEGVLGESPRGCALVAWEPRRSGPRGALTLHIKQPPGTTKRSHGDAAAGSTPSSRWRPILGQRLSKFVAHHRKKWDVVMAFLTIVYVSLGFFQVPGLWNAADDVVWALSGLFFLEFLLRCLDDLRPRQYLRDHWIDLVTCFPAVGPLRLLRLLRLLRVFNSAGIIKKLAADKGDASSTAGLRLLGSTVFIFWLLAGYAFYVTEVNQPRSMVHTFPDALFLAFTTSTTVGFSPMKAVSSEGQIVAGLVIFVGLGLLTAASSRLTSLWIDASSQQAQDNLLREIRDQLGSWESRLAAIEASVGIHRNPPGFESASTPQQEASAPSSASPESGSPLA